MGSLITVLCEKWAAVKLSSVAAQLATGIPRFGAPLPSPHILLALHHNRRHWAEQGNHFCHVCYWRVVSRVALLEQTVSCEEVPNL
jgi:hypothetical protein